MPEDLPEDPSGGREAGGRPIFKNNKQFWLNHVTQAGTLTANSTLGARCKVEVISRSDLLRARGFKVDSLEFDASSVVYDEYVDPGGETDQDDNIAL